MGVEDTITLHFFDTNKSSDCKTGINIDVLDAEMLADVFGTLQTASPNNSSSSTNLNSINFDCGSSNDDDNNNNNNNNQNQQNNAIGLMTSSTSKKSDNNKIFSSNCFISCSNSCNISVVNSPSNGQLMDLNNRGNSNSNSSCSSSGSNFSNNSSEILTNITVPGLNPPIIVKKLRAKISSPTRHGPQQCQICSKVFGNASALAKHKLTHSDERKYVCMMCSKAFKRQDHLNGHMMTHRNKKPYECKAEGCGKSYCDARSLRRHTENHHIASTATAATTTTTITTTPSDVATPMNHSLSASAVPLSGLSLSPATASGDASSPDGATCIRTYITTETIDVGDVSYIKSISSPTSVATSLSTPTFSNETDASPSLVEGITGQQLDIIGQIMQQSKQCGKEISASSLKIDVMHSIRKQKQHQQQQQQQQKQQQDNLNINRPRTWNMQTQLHESGSHKTSVNLSNEMAITELIESESNGDFNNIIQQQQQQQQQQKQQQLVASIHPHILNIVKIDQKPVECNLCHRKFKNVPALNGHMRLHGGYFKKDIESKKTEKKETGGPPLQTASIGVRALIEEKIISKRCKDLKGAFVVPAPPISSMNSTRRIGIENMSTTKICVGETQTILKAINGGNNNISSTSSNSSSQEGAIFKLHQPNIELLKRQQQPVQKSTSVSVGTSTMAVSTTKGTSTDPKDSTLIELLKRGTKIAVAKRNCSTSETQQLLTTNGRSVSIPSDTTLQQSATAVVKTTAPTDSTRNTNQLINSSHGEGTSSSKTDGATPLSLTISQSPTGSGDIYTLTYSADAATLFDETSIYSISDTEMLLQTVNSIQLLSETDSIESINNPIEQSSQSSPISSFSSSQQHQTSTRTLKDLRALLNSPLPDNLIELQTLHSKDLILYNNNVPTNDGGGSILLETKQQQQQQQQQQQSSSTSSSSPLLLSPLAYPTPPASHETVTQSSPFIDETHDFSETSHSFFTDKCTSDFLNDPSGENIIFKSTAVAPANCQLKSSEFDSSSIKVEDLLNESNDAECDLKEFAEQNLSFLNDDQGFLDDSRNPTSPLSESFFTSGIGTAEEVKEVLRDVLPDENISCESMTENVIDLYYLPGLGLQSQMMSNSEDPLLSSSPKDFIHHHHHKGGNHQTTQLFQHQQQQQQQLNRQQYQQNQQQLFLNNSQTSSVDIKGEKQDISYTFLPPDTSSTVILADDNNKVIARENTLSTFLTSFPQPDGISHVNLTESIPVQLQSQAFASQSNVSSSNCGASVNYADRSGTTVSEKIITSSSLVAGQSNNENRQAMRLHPIQSNSILKKRLRAIGSSNDCTTIHSKQTPYISKLRKPSRTHYTPPPMLNPDRKGTGLFSTIGNAKTSLADYIDDFDNTAEELIAFPDESQVNLGSAYQVQIPACKTFNGNNSNDQELSIYDDELMWNPSVEIDEKLLKRYIELSKSSAIPLGFHSEEIALHALLNAKGDTTVAVLMLLQSQSNNSFHLNWSSNEVLVFLKGLESHGKDFYTIAKELKTKSTGECVQLYYFWKKLCGDYKETHLKSGPNSTESSSPLHSAGPLEARPHVCEMPDCSASFTSKAALHGHKRIHCFGRNTSQTNTFASGIGIGNTSQPQNQQNSKDDYPCKVCGKIFTKIKSRSAHMKSHRVQENDGSPINH